MTETQSKPDPSILVVGAGPAGLILALTLLQNGITPRIIQKEHEWRVGQKGSGIQARTLELYRFLGIEKDITPLGDIPPVIRKYPQGGGKTYTETSYFSEWRMCEPGCPDINGILLGQSTHEAVIRRHLEKYGCFVERGVELKSFSQSPNGDVYVELHHTSPSDPTITLEIENARYDWVIGCDGGHSTVRKLLGLTFLGETKEEKLVIGDIEVIRGLEREFWHMWGEPSKKMVSLRPCEDPTYFNIICAGNEFDHTLITSSPSEFIKQFYEISGLTPNDLEFGKIIYKIQVFAPNVRMVDNPRKGRVFVAGDAFHCHSPTGGQGLNTSVQDAVNLGWKLSLIVKGLAPESLLDTYGAERIPVIAEMLSRTSQLLKKAFTPGAQGAWTRGMELRQLGVTYRKSPIVVDESPSATPDEEVDPYRSGGTGGFIRAGDRAPDVPGILALHGPGPLSFFRLFAVKRHVVLIFDEDRTLHSAVNDITKRYKEAGVVSVAVLPSGSRAFDFGLKELDYVYEDQMGYAYKHYKAEADDLKIVVVRPDGVVGAVVKGTEGLQRYLGLVFGKLDL